MRQLSEKFCEWSPEQVAIIDVDVIKAFDNVNHSVLASVLARIGLPTCVIAVYIREWRIMS
eukprot:5090407-Amphidinium_carterae.1